MTTTRWSRVQSLLLLSRREPPGVEQMREEQRQEQSAAGALVSNQKDASDTPTARVSRETRTVISPDADASHLADLSRPEPWWPGMRHPSTSLLLTLGNEVIVGALPTHLSFVLSCVIYGTDSPAFSWEIRSMADSEEDERGAPLASSPRPKPLHLLPLGSVATLGATAAPSVRIAQVRELVQVTFTEQGVYAITVHLNGVEAGRVPLFVQRAPHRGGA